MAEDKKPSRSSKMYNRGPRIEPEGKGDTVKSEGGAPKEAADDAKKTAGSPPSKVETSDLGKSGTNDAKGDVMAGTDGIPTHHKQSGERMEVHNRHMLEHKDMMGRHERDHLARSLGHGDMSHEDMAKAHETERRVMHTRHEGEFRSMNTRHATPDAGIKEKEIGTSGTNKD